MLDGWSGALSSFGVASLLIVGSIALVFTLLLYRIGCYIAPKLDASQLKLQNYSCGEDPSTMSGTIEVRRLFLFTLYFLIFDSAAFLLSLSVTPRDLAPLVFLVILGVTVTTLITKWRQSVGHS
jgi:NADH:ubiquinone oxidoreductase subunit 3 (subunit A)